MVLHIGQVAGYNNETVVVIPSKKLSLNSEKNASMFILVTDTGEKRLVRSKEEKTAPVGGAADIGFLALWAFGRVWEVLICDQQQSSELYNNSPHVLCKPAGYF